MITAREFLDQAWQREDKILLSPNLTRIIERFNQVSYWVATCILTQSSIEKQALIISKFIRLALDLFKLHNYNGVAEITSALHNSAVQRLRQTWLLMPERHLKKLQKLEQIMQPQQNFWTECFDKVQGPKIPYLAVSLRDITFINIGNNNYNEDGSINVDRLAMLHQQVQNIRRLQETAQQTEVKELDRLTDPELIEYCHSPPFIDNDEVLHELAARFMSRTKDVNSNVDSILNNSNILSLFHISDSSDSSLSLTVSVRDRGRGEGDDSWSVLTSETETETESILEEDQDDVFDDEQDDADAAAKKAVTTKKNSKSKNKERSKHNNKGEADNEVDDDDDDDEVDGDDSTAEKVKKVKKKKKKTRMRVAGDEGGDESASSSQDLLLDHKAKLAKKKKKKRLSASPSSSSALSQPPPQPQQQPKEESSSDAGAEAKETAN
ncbi:RasGEF domain containing protein [Acanthamoeba castellanii str. Neff]|uniref:RasGEF domain containing protein n=1 Tax=Acanthamoeba castellanii (strain ATCC 30010 / Neff) TaxID=1257118 RepID=L8GUK0_ACACF|nr:RasGEF domain containing protein [Acanthamoeba castellanii str. Neff]ELR16308.1 RasGEF domain containing protein [Acanthamoeba castellanii str. Neff]